MTGPRSVTSFSRCSFIDGEYGPEVLTAICRRMIMFSICLVLVVITGCSTVPTLRSAESVPEHFSESGNELVPLQWWQVFSDDVLNEMVETAMGHNFDIRAGWDRIDQAAAYLGMTKSVQWPQIQAEFGGDYLDVLGVTESTGGDAFGSQSMSSLFYNEGTTWSLSFGASYEVDLWGRIRAAKQAAFADFLATGEDLHSIAMTVSATIALRWYEYVETELQSRLLEKQLETNRDFLTLLELRFERGLVSAADVLQQRQQLSATEGEVPLVQMRLVLLKNQLAILVGESPHTFHPSVAEGLMLPRIPPFPNTGIPAEILLQRPDIRAARLRLEAANNRIAEAVAARLPRFSIVAGASDEDEKASSLFKNWFATLAANLTVPIFDGGRLKRDVERNEAATRERLNTLGGLTIKALQEIEDAIILESRQKEFLNNLEQQLSLAHATLEVTQNRFYNGSTDYLPVLTALQTLQRLERRKLENERALISYRITLYRALGGIFELNRYQPAQST